MTDHQPDNAPPPGAEPVTEHELAQVLRPAKERPAAEMHGHHHSDVSGGRLRPAVFGAMDGLVTNIALIAGVGGGGASPRVIILTGVAGTVAGAISMALGEYTSVRTQNEQIAAELVKERRELTRHPEAEQKELAAAWRARGLSRELAEAVAEQLHRDPDEALRAHAEAELGVNPDEQPSPWVAAISSFVTFGLGALVPLITYFLGYAELWPALAVGGVGLFAVGAVVSRWTYQKWWFSGLRQLAFGAAAAGVTYLVGSMIGVAAA
jgi:VIT1/CCC1 family predicted Fe2+/Mn2+ transporter